MYRFVGLRSYFIYTGRQIWVFANRDWWKRQGEDRVYESPWNVSICKYPFLSTKRAGHILRRYVCNSFFGEVAIGTCITWRYCDPLQSSGTTHGKCPTSTQFTTGCWGDSEAEEVILFSERIDYVGHVLCPGRPEIAIITTEAIQQLKNLTNKTELHAFLGLCNVSHRFVSNFNRIAAPLNQKRRKDQPKTFNGLTIDEQ